MAEDAGRWRALATLAVALVLGMTTWFSASAVIPQLREEWGLGEGAAAWLTIAVQLGFVAGALLSAVFNISDVLPPRFVIGGSAALAAVANLLLLAADGPRLAIPARFLTGMFLAGVYPPALKLMSTWFNRSRGLALGVMVGALTLGTAGPHLANALGGLDWRVVIRATSLLTVAGGLLVLAAVRDGPYPFPRAAFDMSQARLVLRNRRVRLASAGYFGHMWELYAMWAWFLVFFRTVLDDEGGTAAPLATFFVIGSGAVGCWLGGVLGDRWGRERTTVAMMATSGACALVIGLASDNPAMALLIGLVWGVSVVGDSAQFSTLVTEHADQRYVGTALTLQLALGFTLTVVTIWLLPLFEQAVTWRWAFVLLVPGPLVGIAAMRALARET